MICFGKNRIRARVWQKTKTSLLEFYCREESPAPAECQRLEKMTEEIKKALELERRHLNRNHPSAKKSGHS